MARPACPALGGSGGDGEEGGGGEGAPVAAVSRTRSRPCLPDFIADPHNDVRSKSCPKFKKKHTSKQAFLYLKQLENLHPFQIFKFTNRNRKKITFKFKKKNLL